MKSIFGQETRRPFLLTRAKLLKPRQEPTLPTRTLMIRRELSTEAVASRLRATRFEFGRPMGVALHLTRYERPTRTLIARQLPRARTLVLLVAGADEQGKLDDQDLLCRRIAEELTREHFLVAVADYRKFHRGVAPGDWDGLFSSAYDDLNQGLDFVMTKTAEWQLDPDRVVVVGLSYGGLLQANIAHNRQVSALALGSGFIPPEELPGFLSNKTIPVAVVHNTADQSVPAGLTDWSAGGKAIATELKRRGKTVYESYISTPCSDGNHVPVVGVDLEATITEYIQKLVGNIVWLVP